MVLDLRRRNAPVGEGESVNTVNLILETRQGGIHWHDIGKLPDYQFTDYTDEEH